ncbi:hypothetical protein ACS0TY_025896 [Phlomoides rotata]
MVVDKEMGVAESVTSLGSRLWHRPNPGRVKVNVDATTFAESSSIGVVVKDDTGSFVVSRSLCFPGVIRASVVEVVGLHEALLWIKYLGLDSVDVEMNAKVIVVGWMILFLGNT